MQDFECVACKREARSYAKGPRCVCGKTMTVKDGVTRPAPAVIVGEWAEPSGLDLVTVTHNDRNRREAEDLEAEIDNFAELPYTMQIVDNRHNHKTYAAACNTGAALGTAPVIGFINPDCVIGGPFMREVTDALKRDRYAVIVGERFGKPAREIRKWGLLDWVCGACFFVRREWFDYVGGFDERYLWSWEETDLCRAAERGGFVVRSLMLPMRHESPAADNARDLAFKKRGFDVGRNLYERKWPH